MGALELARSLDDERIRASAGTMSVQRGKAYARGGAVQRIQERGNDLDGLVQGNERDPYAVRVELDAAGVASATCTCAFSGVGWCKHVVALLVAARMDLAMADAVGERSPDAPRTGRPPVDGAAVSRRVGAIIRSLTRMRPSQAYWHVGDVMRRVSDVLAEAQRLLDADRASDALVILSSITSNYVRAWQYLDDSDGFVGDFGRALAPVWTEALLSADLDAVQRRSWTKKLHAWNADLTEIGLDDCLAACVAAAAGAGDFDDFSPQVRDQLVDAQLNILERRGDDAAFLSVAGRHGRVLRYAKRLIELNRVDEAVSAVGVQPIHPSAVLELARCLRRLGELDRAVTLAEEALERDGSGDLAEWLWDVADGLGRPALARAAARAVVRARPSVPALRRFRALMPPAEWVHERERVVAALRGAPVTDGSIAALLDEGVIAEAIAAVDRLSWVSFGTLSRVAEAAATAQPDWAIATATRHAERILDTAQSTAYRHAVRWLKLAAAAYRHAGREPEWLAYRAALLAKHRLKRTFIAAFESVG